jgi:hypothetical protein
VEWRCFNEAFTQVNDVNEISRIPLFDSAGFPLLVFFFGGEGGASQVAQRHMSPSSCLASDNTTAHTHAPFFLLIMLFAIYGKHVPENTHNTEKKKVVRRSTHTAQHKQERKKQRTYSKEANVSLLPHTQMRNSDTARTERSLPPTPSFPQTETPVHTMAAPVSLHPRNRHHTTMQRGWVDFFFFFLKASA